MKKLISNTLFLTVILALAISVYMDINADIRQKKLVDNLQAQVQQLNTELTTIKHQQILNNAVTEDLSQRVGWR